MDKNATKRALLESTFSLEVQDILKTIKGYAVKLGLAYEEPQLGELAREVLSETALTVLAPDKVEQFDPEQGVAVAWIKRVALRKVMGIRRDRARRIQNRKDPRRPSETPALDTPEAAGLRRKMDTDHVTQDDVLGGLSFRNATPVEDEIGALAQAAMERARPRDQALLEAYYLEEKPAEAIAEQLRVSPAAVYTGLSRARKRLRNTVSLDQLREKL